MTLANSAADCLTGVAGAAAALVQVLASQVRESFGTRTALAPALAYPLLVHLPTHQKRVRAAGCCR